MGSRTPDPSGLRARSPSCLRLEATTQPEAERSPPGPCDEELGKAKFCVTLKVAGDRPTATAPADMAIDGSGKTYLALYDKDPQLTGANLVKVVEAPNGEAVMGENFSAQIFGESAPGVYSVIGFLADSTNERGIGKASVLPGDYVTAQSAAGLTFSYPKITLTAGKVYKSELSISAVRRVTLSLLAGDSLDRRDTSVHGSGPAFLGLTDSSSFTDATTWLHFDTRGCVNLNLDKGIPTSGVAKFPVTVTGTRNIFAGVIDYDANTPMFPGIGTLVVSNQVAPLEQVTINPTSWTADASVKLVSAAYGAMAAGSIDPTPTCN